MNCSFSGDCGEVLKEFVQRLPAFQIVQQSLKRDARSSENGSSPEDIGVLDDYLVFLSEHDIPSGLSLLPVTKCPNPAAACGDVASYVSHAQEKRPVELALDRSLFDGLSFGSSY
jgi:hypothetical protein